MNVDMSIIQMFLGLGAAAIVAGCGFVIALSRQVSALASAVETMSRMQSQERNERIASVERVHERLDNTQRTRHGDVHL